MDADGEHERLEETLERARLEEALADPNLLAEGDRRRIERTLAEQRKLLSETDPKDARQTEELLSSIDDLERALRRLEEEASASQEDTPYGMHRNHPQPWEADWIRQNPHNETD